MPSSLSVAPRLPLYFTESRYEFLRLLRARTYTLVTVGFPLMFYMLFGVVNSHPSANPLTVSRYLLATYTIFGLVGTSLFGIGATLANERALGWLEIKRASPMPPSAYLVAKLLTAFAFAFIVYGLLLTTALTLGHVHLSAHEMLRLAGVVAIGVLPFTSLGLLLALCVPPQAAVGVINLIYLPMSFCSGLWMPIDTLPHWLQSIAPLWPSYHLAQIALNGIGFPTNGSFGVHLAALALFTCIMLSAAIFVFRRSSARS